MNKKVFVYCRKSSEQEDRQVLSLDSQECELMKVVESNNLSVLHIYKESGSAHVIGRKDFNEMITRIENGEAQGIVVWDESRIARNSLDGGKIIYMMDLGQITEIYKPGKVYKNTPDDKSWMSMVFMMSKKESDDKGVNAKRGMTDKAKKGWMPSAAPLGYKNTPILKKDYKEIVIDEEKFPLVRRLFDEILSGKQACQVYKKASEKWKLTSQLGTVFSKSTFYNLLTKPFYYGEFEWPKNSGNWYKGRHTPMITRDEFDRVQKALGKKGKPIAHTQTFDLTGLFRCSKCGSAITATKKVKYYATTGNTVSYTYYHCTKKNKKIKCDAKPLTEKDLVKQIDNLLLLVKQDEEFIVWAKKWISVVHQYQSSFHEETLKSQQKALEATENRLNKLLDMRLNDLLDDNAYNEKKKELEQNKRDIKDKLADIDLNLDNGRMKIENALDFAYTCQKRFELGAREIKQEIMTKIGENLCVNTNKLLDVKLKSEFEVLADKDNWGQRFKDWLEPQEYTDIMAKNVDLRPTNPLWLPRVDSNHGPAA